MQKKPNGITLLELLIAIILLSVVVLALTSINVFSRFHVLSADRKGKLQNELALALAHMGKYVQRGVGSANAGAPALELFGPPGPVTGFCVMADLNEDRLPAQIPTPADQSDDIPITYTLAGNTLTAEIVGIQPPQVLSTHILAGIVVGQMPLNPPSGFYINLTDNDSVVEVGLAARHNPLQPVSVDNPQVTFKTRLYARGSPAAR